ncbi:MAG: dTDP-glucose 4,6-dehydratase [Fimbriimonadaceae bacterium]|nr:MAG: dTDP-glucose 4,6-dehydratase [Fimbriimonadaceae bacterium]
MRILVTGGCGFIGANFLNLYVPKLRDVQFLNLDALTYAGNPLSLQSISDAENYEFRRVNLADSDATAQVVSEFQPTHIVHFAAETHVDRSIKYPRDFLNANIIGTFNLLEAARQTWGENYEGKVFHHVSTDEVFGELGETGLFSETTPYAPNSPYSASKASSDHMVRAWQHTYGLPIKITNCSNNYGPYQFPEKLIPLMSLNALAGKPLPVYGTGANIRDWLFVGDHCEAIFKVMTEGKVGETYNVGGNSERTNLQVVHALCESVADITNQSVDQVKSQITFVPDRPGHDFRYAIDASKIQKDLDWKPSQTFEKGLHQTVKWYHENTDWVESVKSGDYQTWIDSHYGQPGVSTK